jgi:hypothetical protein
MQRSSITKLPKKRQPRANILLRAGRMLRCKRVAYERILVADTIRLLKRQIARMEATAKAHNVPLPAMAPLPALPDLPGREWVEFLASMGDLREPVKPQAEPDPRDAFGIAWNKRQDAT